MAILLRMPGVAANATHATLQAWTKNEGDPIAVGDCIAEIETEKAVVEMNADADGVMGRRLCEVGEEIEVGAPIGVLLVNGETSIEVDALIAAALGGSEPIPGASETPAQPEERAEPHTASVNPPRVFASPLARRLARQHGVDLAGMKGSGPNGRIVKSDVQRAAMESAAQPPVAKSAAVAAPLESIKPVESFIEIPHSGMRRTIARRLSESKSTVPHFYLTADCRMEQLLALRQQVNAGASRKISINDFIVRAVAVALREVPEANVGWTDAAMRQYKDADIAVAVSTESGLVTPIIRSADQKTISAISGEIAELSARARAGRLRPEEYQGGTFSISNLGMYGVSEFSAIINPPQAAILAVGACQAAPVVENGQIIVGQTMRCTLSVDHRAIDGALAAQWFSVFKRLVENPFSMLI